MLGLEDNSIRLFLGLIVHRSPKTDKFNKLNIKYTTYNKNYRIDVFQVFYYF